MLLNERTERENLVIEAAKQIMIAARTAPKSCGTDFIEIGIIYGEDKLQLAKEMQKLFEETNRPLFLRDSKNVEQAQAVVLIGINEKPLMQDCGRCGFPICDNKPIDTPCVFNSIDVGIAAGSACRTAMQLCIDSRLMYTAGRAAQRLSWPTPNSKQVLALLLSASSKNPFFDRKQQTCNAK